MKCNGNFRTEYALVNGEEIHIRDYIEGSYATCISNHHELISVKGNYNKHHFRHKHSCDVNNSPLSEWHSEWQSHFKYIEVQFPLREGQIKSRRADIVIGDFVIDVQYTNKPGTVVEVQHSPITLDEVNHRNHDYGLHHKKVLWIIDGVGVTLHNNILVFEKDFWKFDSFLNTSSVYIDIHGIIYAFNPADVKSCSVHVSETIDQVTKKKIIFEIPKLIFVKMLNDGCDISNLPSIQNKLYIKQQGAGNGKTWGIIQMLARPEFSHYTRFIYVTKQHSARFIIYEEFISQQDSLGITNVSKKESSKKYIIQYRNASKIDCSIIISTIDSFMYALGDKQTKERDLFEGIVRSICKPLEKEHDKTIIHNTIQKNGKISYANQAKLNAHTLYIVDETQDLHESYADALWAIMKHTNMDVYVVGDKLQSIHFEENAFTNLMTKESNSQTSIVKETPVNCCRRFIHPKLVDFVNEMIPFHDFNLLPIVPWKEYDGKEYEPLEIFPIIKNKGKEIPNIETCVNSFMWKFEKEVCENFRCPEDFLIVTPWVNSGISTELINHIDLVIQEFWVKQLQNKEFVSNLNEYWKKHDVDKFNRYSVLHRTEEGSCINLDDSKYATRIVSIHASKGDGRNVVFLIDPSLFKLNAFSIKNSLKFYSTLHVALTRMKEKLYIMHDNDEISNKIKNSMSKTNSPFMSDTLHISEKSTYKELSIFITPNTELFETQKSIEYVNDTDSTKIIDTSHHTIRYWIMRMKTCDILKDGDQLEQIATIFGYAMGNRSCILHGSWKEYNEDLKKNNNIHCDKCKKRRGFIHDKDLPLHMRRRDASKFCTQHSEEHNIYDDRSIPLLKLPTQEHHKYVIIIQQTIDKIKYNFKTQIPLCPFELIVQMYMVEVVDRGQYAEITMNELYNVIDIYSKAFKHYMKGHDNCLCKKIFPHNEDKNSLYDYLCSHYEQMESYEKMIQQMKDVYKITHWNFNYKVEFSGEHFHISTMVDFIGYNETTCVILYIKPNLNNLNFNDIKYHALLDKFIVQYCSEKDDYKYKNKEVVCCVLSLNQINPYILPLQDVPDMKLKLGPLLKQKYERKHSEVKAFYDYWMVHERIFDEIDKVFKIVMNYHKSIDKMVKEYERQEYTKKIKNASYITSVFTHIQSYYNGCEDGDHDKTPEEYIKLLSSDGKGNLLNLLQSKLNRFLKEDGFVK
jgi:hypothetical protein